ncbi:hypothetical protein VPH35_110633 [Triticum aestivum]|uniref:uncharacterized protein isoform X2 n=1 Tax=Triticum aestivum TaxID=4565 RepID=UPI0008449980|nr:uncharacterized protein LOC123136908 isoform X2 [Triticum aestivum]
MVRPLFARRRPPPEHAGIYPNWVLLDTVVRGANYDWEKMSMAECSASLATTARTFVDVRSEAESKEEVVVELEVSFLFVSPPDVSGFVVHVGDYGLSYGASVVSTDGNAVLLAITMAMFNLQRYLVYRVDRGNPSLEVLPDRPMLKFHPTKVVGILSHGKGYVVAALTRKLKIDYLAYELFLYTSQTKAWSSKVIPLECTRDADLIHVLNHHTTKVITVGVDSLGWVDLWRGILFCNVLDENPVVRFLSFPCPMPSNACNLGTSCPRPFRDVICIGNTLKFVEVEYNQGEDDTDYGSNTDHGWKATTQKRNLGSEWTECFSVDTSDILLTDESWDLLSHRLRDDDARQLSLSKLECLAPTLGMDDDYLYMMTRPLGSNEKPLGLFASLDIKNKDMRLVSFSTERMSYIDPNYRPCTVSHYFNNTSVAGKPLKSKNEKAAPRFIIGENLRWIGLVKLAVLSNILVSIQRLTSLDAMLMKPERPDETQLDQTRLTNCSASVEMLGQMAHGISSYTDHLPATSIQYHVNALKEGFSILGGKTFPFIDNDEYASFVDITHFKILDVVKVARSLVKELLPKRLDDPHYSLRSVERTLMYGELPLTPYLRRLDLSEGCA